MMVWPEMIRSGPDPEGSGTGVKVAPLTVMGLSGKGAILDGRAAVEVPSIMRLEAPGGSE